MEPRSNDAAERVAALSPISATAIRTEPVEAMVIILLLEVQ